MALLKALFGIIFKLRDWIQGKFGSLFDNLRDPETGKFNFGRPQTIKLIVIVVAGLIFALILINSILTSEQRVTGGGEAFNEELAPTTGIRSQDVKDPLASLSGARDVYNDGSQGDQMRNTLDDLGVNSPTGAGSPLSVGQCLPVIEKMQKNLPLDEAESALARECVEQNPMGLTEDQIKFANQMLDPNVTAEEKVLLAKALAGTATPEELAVARALSSANADERALARQAVASGDPSAIAALGKQLNGNQLTAEEQARIAQLRQSMQSGTAGVAGAPGAAGTSGGSTAGGVVTGSPGAGNLVGGGSGVGQIPVETLPGIAPEVLAGLPPDVIAAAAPLTLPPSPADAVKTLSQDIGSREITIADLEKDIGQRQLRTAGIAEKLAAGRQITAPEAKQLQDLITARQQLETLRKVQEQRKTEFAKRVSSLQTSLAQAVSTVQQSLAAGTFIEYEGPMLDCNKVAALPIKRRGVKRVAKKDPGVLDVDGRPLRPEEVEFIKLQRRGQMEVAQAKSDALNPQIPGLGQALNAGNGGEGAAASPQDIAQVFIFRDNSLKTFEFTADMRIPAVLASEVLISDKGQPQVVSVRLLADVRNPQTNALVIPKGAVGTATTAGFDKDTGVMNLTIDRVSFGGKNLAVRFNVGSGNGYFGLRGRVHDTTGKYLLGAFVTSFSSGIIGALSSNFIGPFQEATNFADNATGAALAGTAEVGNRIAQLYASKLQNAAVVFWVPRGVPIVLIPQ